MNEVIKKLTEEVKAEISERFRAPEFQEVLERIKDSNDSGSFEVVISSADLDRQGEIIDQNGWELGFYRMNPVVLWAHDYYSLPIGVCDEIDLKDGKLVARGRFAPEEANPFAQQVRRLYDLKIVRATSVGLIPKEVDGEIVRKAELLEFSFVPVPANPYALTLREVQKYSLNLPMLAMKGLEIKTKEEAPAPSGQENQETKGAIPYEDHGTAPEDTEWDAAKEVQAVGDDYEKLKKMCAWYDSEKPDVQASYKLPHHQADGLKAVWKGVAAAMAALLGARGGVDIPEGDRKAVYNHLAKHYAEFEKEPPDFKAEVPANTKPEPETTGDYIIIRVKDPEYFDPDSFRTIVISNEKGIKATTGCQKGQYEDGKCNIGVEVQRFLFDKTKWTLEDAQAWADEHKNNSYPSVETDETTNVPRLLDIEKIRAECDAHKDRILQIVSESYGTEGGKGLKAGRVISEKNRKLIGDSVEQLKKAIAALEELLQATEPQGSEPEGGGKENPHGETKVESAGLDKVKADLELYHATRRILRAVDIAVEEGLRKLKGFTPDKNR